MDAVGLDLGDSKWRWKEEDGLEECCETDLAGLVLRFNLGGCRKGGTPG